MSRTLEPGVSLLTAAEIRVVVVPIGPMPRDTFEAYLEALNAHRHVPLNATASFHQCGPKSPFPHLPYKTGAMHFRFMQAEDARRRRRVADLHVQRNVVAVLGLLHCPLVEDLSAAHSEFQRSVRQWPEALVARCAAFEPSPAHLAAPTAKLQDLMIFPAGHLDQHLEVYMHEFAAAALSAIEEHLLNATVASIKLNTYVDSGEFLGSLVQIEEGLRKLNINEEEVKEKKRWGRLQKSKGDWSLLVGSPKDAFEHYKSAMELSRAAGDAIWYGAAVEGLAHARVLEALLSARLAAAGGNSHHGRPPSAKPPLVAAAVPPEALDSPSRPISVVAVGPDGAGDGDQQGTAFAVPSVSTQAGSSSSSSTDVIAAGGGLAEAADAAAAAAAAAAGGHDADSASAEATGAFSASPFAASAGEGVATAVPTQQVPADIGVPSTPAVDPPDNSSNSSSSAAAGRASSLPAMPPPPSPTAAAATAAAAAQLARRRSVGSGAAALPPNYSLSGQAFCVMLASADLEGEVRELLTEAKSWYRKKGGALPLQIEQSVKLCRFLACTAAGTAASAAGSSGGAAAAAVPVLEALKAQLKAEVDAAVGFILENLAALTLMEDRAVALAEAAQLLGLAGCGRKRLLLLWAALDLVRTGGAGPAAVAAGSGFTGSAGEMGPTAGAAVDVWGLLKLSLTAMEPPDQPGQQDPDDVLRVHWSLKRFISSQQQHMQALAAAASRQQQQQHGSSSGSNGSDAAAAVPQQQQPWQQQQFQQLLGPQLQLLTALQAGALESPRLLQQLPAKQRPQGSPSKLGMVGSSVGGLQAALNAPQPLQHGSGFGVLVGVLAGMLNPSNVQQWLPGSGCLWDSLQVALMEVLVNAARLANAPVDAWEAAATLLREFYPLLPQSLQSSLMETLSTSGAAMGTRLRSRPGPGPGPQVQLKRLVPGPACLQPQYLSADSGTTSLNLRRGEGTAGSGPFIFDPHAAKRKAASAAAAAQAAIPEWVCGEEGRVEVLLVNTCATPLKLDGLQLQVHPQQQEPHPTPGAAGAGVGTAGDGSNGSSSNAAATQQQQQQRSVSVMLAAGSKPIRVLLSHVPNKAGYVAITGVQAMSKGVSWYQPFVQLLPAGGASSGGAAAAAAAVMAAAGGRDQAKQQGCFTVLVQPRLPLIKASLQGPEVQITLPSEDDLSPFTGSTSTSSSSSNSGPSAGSSWSSAAVYGNPPAAAGGGPGVGPDLEKKAASVAVFEGQVLSWTLNLTNISSQPITGCKVTVLRLDAKGAVQRAPAIPPGVAGPPPSLTGAYLEVLDQGLAAGLPLQPGASLALPVSVVVGKPPGSYDASTMQVCITYHGAATSVSSSNGADPKPLGRSLTVPIRLAIQPTIQVRGMRFLQQGLPLRHGTRDDIILSKPQRLLLQTLREGRDHEGLGSQGLVTRGGVGAGVGGIAAAGVSGSGSGVGSLRRGASHHVRNNSEGSVPVAGVSVGPMLPLPQSPSRLPAALGGDGTGLSNIPSGVSLNDSSTTGVDSSMAAAGAGEAAAALEGGPGSPTKQHGAAARQGASAAAAAAAAAAGGVLALCSQPVLELAVRNASERYFRTWLGCLPDRLTADKALSAVAVLEPGDQEKLTAAVPTAATAATATASSKSSTDAAAGAAAAAAGAAAAAAQAAGQPLVQVGGVVREPPRLAAAEELVGRLVVCWEMITGAAAAGVLPHGCVPLEPLDVAANLTPVALAGLCPSPLHLRLSVPPASAVPSTHAPSHMVDLSALLASSSSSSASSRSSIGGSGGAVGQHRSAGGVGPAADSGLKLPGVTGPVWGLHMKVGQHLVFDLDVTYAAAAAAAANAPAAPASAPDSSSQAQQLDLQVTLFALDTLSMNGTQPSSAPTAAAAAATDRAGAGSPYAASLLSGQSMGPRSFAALLGAATGTPKAAEASTRNTSLLGAVHTGTGEGLVDPGVLLTGCYNKLQVAVAPGGRHTCRMHALLVQPGLYVFGVADVQQVLGAADAVGGQGTLAAAAAAAGKAGSNGQKGAADSDLPGRLYYNQDRLYVLVTR